MKFYTHLYKTLFTLHAGMFSEDACLVHMCSLGACLIIIVADEKQDLLGKAGWPLLCSCT